MRLSFREWDDSESAPQEAASLAGDEVQVWTATVPSAQECGRIAGALNQDERDRADRFRLAGARNQFIFSRALLRQILGACLRVEPAAVTFGHGPCGKPSLAPRLANGDLRFNISHSGEIVAIAIASGREVGVDIESVRCLEEWSPLAERIFSASQLRDLHALPESQQRRPFSTDGPGRKPTSKPRDKG
jgi:4'-phosphopantetheinyl transferase